MNNTKCIQIIKNFIMQKGSDEKLERLIEGIERGNTLFLDLIPTDLIKDLIPEATGLKWTRRADYDKDLCVQKI